ncbi:MAG: FimB/Mfa2 family fimbrial subunit [Prevotella sp.]|nr:FimB/Mfa2 family fimbrial subunit [Prevotella sp.]
MQFINKTIMALAACAGLGACSLMTDDLDDCPQGLSVEFVYDYNVERANMFNDHVGSVTLYVYDEAGRLVRTQTEDNSASAQPLRNPNYRMTVDGLQPGEYRLLALANQRRYADISQLNGVRYLRAGESDGMTSLNVTLADLPARQAATAIRQQLDTLWHGTLRSAEYTQNPVTRADGEQVEAQTVTVREHQLTSCVVSLVRDTKRLHISLRQSDDPAHCDIADFDIKIVDRNGHLLWDNTVDLEGTPDITYRPFDEWNTYYDGVSGQSSDVRPSDDDENVEETAHADLDFNRLMLRPGSAAVAPAFLTITKREDGTEVARINLPEILQQGRGAFERQYYAQQEFLDRAYDYRLDFILVGDKWSFMSLGIHSLPWTLRLQNVELR